MVWGAVLFALTACSTSAVGFRLSFIEDGIVLEDTCRLLRENGFSEDSVAKFRKLVTEHNKPGNRVDRAKFPPLQDGYYHFDSLADLTNRTACAFFETPGSNLFPETTLMCFDVSCLLLSGSGSEAARVEDDFATKDFVFIKKDGSLAPASLENLRNGVGVLFPANGYEFLVGGPRSDAEARIGLSLRAKRRLPPGRAQSEKDLRSIFSTYVSRVKADGFRFPGNCKIGLGLLVNSKRQYICGDHAFICIRKHGRFICLEKDGAKGPYVRVEFDSEEDIASYMSWSLLLDVANPESSDYGSAVLISLNDRLIGVYPSSISP